MARRRIGVADVKEILVQWDAGAGISAIGQALGYTRPTSWSAPCGKSNGE